MSDFGERKTVKTKKIHQCVSCGRRIPIGKKAHNFRGMWEGDWQNWYMCIPCDELNVCEDNEEIGGDEFNEWLRNSDYMDCSECHGLTHRAYGYYTEWDWDDKDEKILFECEECGHKWEKFIGFDSAKEVNP